MRDLIGTSRPNKSYVMSCGGRAAHAVRFLLLVALVSARAATCDAIAAAAATQEEGPDSNICAAVIPPQGLTSFSNALGWNAPQYYSTVRLVDVDGDAQDDLVARGSAGIFVSHFDSQRGLWNSPQQTNLLSDASGGNLEYVYGSMRFGDIDGARGAELVAINRDGLRAWKYDRAAAQWQQLGQPIAAFDGGWAPPQYYSTLRLADIDGGGRAELIARGVGGLLVFRWDEDAGVWDTLAAGGILGDAGDWDLPEYYETIRFADIDGARGGAAELLVRGSAGLLTYRWEAQARAWSYVATLTELSDAGSWVLPEYYATIRAADVDGDGAAELVARGSGGVYTWRWDRAGSSWGRVGEAVGWFSDAGGWGLARYYETVELAEVDGAAGAELLGRAQAGMSAFAWDGQSNNWRQIVNPITRSGGTSGVMGDLRGWRTPDTYETVRYGDIDGDGRAEIIGRSHKEVETWRLDSAGDGFVPAILVGGFPAFPAGQSAAYAYISDRLIPGGNGDIRGQYVNKALSQNFNGAYLFCLNGDPCPDGTTLSRPDGVAEADWEAVKSQLRLEFGYVVDINAWFTQNALFLQSLNSLDIVSVNLVSGKLSLSNENAALDIAALVLDFVAAIADLGGEPGEVVAAAAEIISTSIEAGAYAASEGQPNLQVAVSQINQQLINQILAAQKANDCNLQYYLRNWGLMQSLGSRLAQGRLVWDDTLSDNLRVRSQQAYELYVWKTLTPLKWRINNTGICPYYCTEVPDDYPGKYDGLAYEVYGYNTTTSRDEYWFINVPSYDPFYDVFTKLGVPIRDVVYGRNGWNVPKLGPDPIENEETASAAPTCTALCFRAPQYYSNNLWNGLPRGQVWVPGVQNRVNTRDVRTISRALRGGDSAAERFTQHFVAAQLSTLAADESGRRRAALSKINCGGASFAPVRLSNGVTLSPDSTLLELLRQAEWASRAGQPADIENLSLLLDLNDGDDPDGGCNLN